MFLPLQGLVRKLQTLWGLEASVLFFSLEVKSPKIGMNSRAVAVDRSGGERVAHITYKLLVAYS